MKKFLNDTTIKLKHSTATCAVIKCKDSAAETVQITDGAGEWNTAGLPTGKYYVQFFKDEEIVENSTIILEQNLATAPDDYDPTPECVKILEAINSYLAGTATHQQRRVKIGEKEIEYSSFDELIKWKKYYEQQVRIAEGKPSALKQEKLYFKGI